MSGLPINGDFEDGYGETPEDVRATVDAAIARGLAGIGVEDTTGDPANPIRDFDDAVRRMEAAAAAARGQIVLTGRTDNFLWGISDIDDTIRRLCAYAEAGADVLYAPNLPDVASIRQVIGAVTPKPVNVLVGPKDTATLADLQSDRCPEDQPRGRPVHARRWSHAGGCCKARKGRSQGARDESRLWSDRRSHQGLSSLATCGTTSTKGQGQPSSTTARPTPKVCFAK